MKNLYARNYLNYYRSLISGNKIRSYISYYIAGRMFKRIYLKYIEIPITTYCTLNCKECSNLMQYYQKPANLDVKALITSLRRLLDCVDGIKLFRVLGGEPLVHPDVSQLLDYMSKQNKIHEIQIVTNGTMLPSEEVIDICKRNHNISFEISNYEEKSRKKNELIALLNDNDIRYICGGDRIFWTRQSDIRFRGRSAKELSTVFQQCTLDCISLFKGRLHVCPRSSHGSDLDIFKPNESDYVKLKNNRVQNRLGVYRLLNTKSVTACNYCDNFRWRELEEVVAAEQISKSEAHILFEKQMTK